MNILWVTFGLPYPTHSGARLRDYHLISYLAQRHSIHLFSLLESKSEAEFSYGLEPYCASIEMFPPTEPSWHDRFDTFVRHIGARRPLATLPFMHAKMIARIRQASAHGSIDAVQIEHSFLAPYVQALSPRFRGPRVLSLHNLGERQYRQMARLGLPPQTRFGFVGKSWLMRGWEARYAEHFDRVITVSDTEAQQLVSSNPRVNAVVVENGVNTKECQALPETTNEPTLLFVGTLSYPPNVDAAIWFCDEILPRVARYFPAVHLSLVGRSPSSAVRALASRNNVSVIGPVSDLQPFYERAAVCIVPLRAGGGTRLKILEAMAYGRAVVSTRVGCEGLAVRDGDHLLIADTADAFSERVADLLSDRERRQTMAARARVMVETQYDWSIIGEKLLSVYSELER